jgi:uncharacterized glyoxalase superfamily protein PhnB
MRLAGIEITSSNLRTTAAFYELLGFAFRPFTDEEKHIVGTPPEGDAKLLIDDRAMMAEVMGHAPTTPNHSILALEFDSPAEVDTVVEKMRTAGAKIYKEPWDAFWGQRYAVLGDPDGYAVDVFAKL